MRRWKSFLLLLTVSLIFSFGRLPVAQSCGYQPGYFENETIFFLSSLAQDPIFQRYNFDEQHRRSEYQFDEDVLANRRDQNLKEWQQFFGAKLNREELIKLIYETPGNELERMIKSTTPGQKNFGKLAILLQRPEYRPAVDYLLYARRVEPFCTVDRWSWDVESDLAKRRNPQKMQRLMDEAESRYQKTASIFLKQRYGYQLVRLVHYIKDYQSCIDLYDRYINPLPKNSIVCDWAYRHKIGAMLKMGKEAESLVLTSLVFDQNPKMVDEAYLDYRTPTETVWRNSLKLAKHPHRQATLWMLRGLKEPRLILEPLQKMVELEPGSPRVEVMLVRYLNRLECELFNSAYFLETKQTQLIEERENGLKYCRELKEYLKTVDKRQFRQPSLWYAALGYLSIMEKSHFEADEYLETAQTLLNGKNPDLGYQIQALKLLNTLVEQPKITSAMENGYLDVLNWLDAYQGQKNNRETIHHAFYHLIGQKYLVNNDFPKAYLCMAKAGKQSDYLLELYPSISEMDQLINLISKTGKSEFEKIITSGLPWSVDDYLAVQGTSLLRKARYQDALERFQKVASTYWEKYKEDDLDLVKTSFEQNYYNPRTGLYKYPENGFIKYTKLEFTRKVIELEKKAVKDPANAAVYYYQIANGFFHTPFWGFNEQLWPYQSSIWFDGESYPYHVLDFGHRLIGGLESFNREYGQRKLALGYYLKAMNTTNDPELAAKCCFLAAACMTEFSFYHEFQETGKGKTDYFDILRQKYPQTDYYQKIIRECATLKDYLQSK